MFEAFLFFITLSSLEQSSNMPYVGFEGTYIQCVPSALMGFIFLFSVDLGAYIAKEYR